MPTFSTIAFKNMLEPRVRDSYKKPLNFNQITPASEESRGREPESVVTEPPAALRHIYISPALYTTPEPTPIPETASEPLSPSPYVVNHKRRGGGVGAVGGRRSIGFEVQGEEEKQKEEGGDLNEVEEVIEDNFGDGCSFEEGGNDEEEEEDQEEDFLDSRCESLSVGSAAETIRQFDSRSYVSTQGEFFDAIEDFSTENSISNAPSFGSSGEAELRATRLSLLEEIERRKSAEEGLSLMHSQWQKIIDILSEAGFTCPTPSNVSGSIQCENASVEELAQEVIVARFVAEAIGKGQVRAEAELAAEVILESKDQEISRLRDRLQYYEAVNHEMSQRNQEIIDVARKQRQRKKTQRKWFWSCIGLSITIGISVLAYSYLPHSGKHQELPSTSDSSCDSCISSSEAA